MPRKTKRRLSLNQNVSDVIPYSKVRVEWIDILSDSGWADEKGFNKMKQHILLMKDGCTTKIDMQLSYLLLTIGKMMGL